MLKQQIDSDLKKALLAGDKLRVTTLRSLKSVILYAEVALGAREVGLDDEAIVNLFAKEVKKRQESADLFTKGGSPDRAKNELAEKAIIEEYLPKQLSDEQLAEIVDACISKTQAAGIADMGKVIGVVKSEVASQADGARIAQIVKQRLTQ